MTINPTKPSLTRIYRPVEVVYTKIEGMEHAWWIFDMFGEPLIPVSYEPVAVEMAVRINECAKEWMSLTNLQAEVLRDGYRDLAKIRAIEKSAKETKEKEKQ